MDVLTIALTLLDPTTATAQEGTRSPQMNAHAKVLTNLNCDVLFQPTSRVSTIKLIVIMKTTEL